MNQTKINNIPFIGSGMGFRRQLKQQIYAHKNELDCLEIITDQYIWNDLHMAELEELCDNFQVIPHGIGLSIGSIMPFNAGYIKNIKRINEITKSSYYSEHLCMTLAPGIDIGHLSPLWFTNEVLNNVIDRVNYVQDTLGKPLILENVTYLVDIPNSAIGQTEFFHKLVDKTNCGILLDITNIFINSVNHNFDPHNFIDAMPLANVVQVHIAGGYWADGLLIDSHSEAIQAETWELLNHLNSLTKIKSIILEHDSNFPDNFDHLLSQVSRARDAISN